MITRHVDDYKTYRWLQDMRLTCIATYIHHLKRTGATERKKKTKAKNKTELPAVCAHRTSHPISNSFKRKAVWMQHWGGSSRCDIRNGCHTPSATGSACHPQFWTLATQLLQPVHYASCPSSQSAALWSVHTRILVPLAPLANTSQAARWMRSRQVSGRNGKGNAATVENWGGKFACFITQINTLRRPVGK